MKMKKTLAFVAAVSMLGATGVNVFAEESVLTESEIAVEEVTEIIAADDEGVIEEDAESDEDDTIIVSDVINSGGKYSFTIDGVSLYAERSYEIKERSIERNGKMITVYDVYNYASIFLADGTATNIQNKLVFVDYDRTGGYTFNLSDWISVSGKNITITCNDNGITTTTYAFDKETNTFVDPSDVTTPDEKDVINSGEKYSFTIDGVSLYAERSYEIKERSIERNGEMITVYDQYNYASIFLADGTATNIQNKLVFVEYDRTGGYTFNLSDWISVSGKNITITCDDNGITTTTYAFDKATNTFVDTSDVTTPDEKKESIIDKNTIYDRKQATFEFNGNSFIAEIVWGERIVPIVDGVNTMPMELSIYRADGTSTNVINVLVNAITEIDDAGVISKVENYFEVRGDKLVIKEMLDYGKFIDKVSYTYEELTGESDNVVKEGDVITVTGTLSYVTATNGVDSTEVPVITLDNPINTIIAFDSKEYGPITAFKLNTSIEYSAGQKITVTGTVESGFAGYLNVEPFHLKDCTVTLLDDSNNDRVEITEMDYLTVTGTLSYETAGNGINTVIVPVLTLDTPVDVVYHTISTEHAVTEGMTEHLTAVQLSGIEEYKVGQRMTVTGKVVFAHTGAHIKNVVLTDCTVKLLDDDSNNNSQGGSTGGTANSPSTSDTMAIPVAAGSAVLVLGTVIYMNKKRK